MPTQLRIVFTGLCVFVPDPARNVMHVLLPATDNFAHPGSGHDANSVTAAANTHHTPRAIYDTAYTRTGATSKDGIQAHLMLTDRVLTIPPVSGSPIDLSLPSQLADLTTITGETIPAQLLQDDPDGKLIARVELAAGAYSSIAPGACWSLGSGPNRRLPHTLEWTVSLPDGLPVQWVLGLLHSAGMQVIPHLNSISGLITVMIFHGPPSGLPPTRHVAEPPVSTPAHHFPAYYDIFAGAMNRPVPLYQGEAGCTGGGSGTPVPSHSRSEVAYNCMLAKAVL